MDRRFIFMKRIDPRGLPVPASGLYDHNIQTASSLKLLSQLKPNFMWSIVR